MCLALGLHQHRPCWSTFTSRDLEDGMLMPSQPSSLLGGPRRMGIDMQAGRSFQVGFLRGRMEKADRGRRWEVSKASSMAADTCFFQNRLNLSPCHHLSVVLGCFKPPASWRARGLRAAPSSCTRPSSSSPKRGCFLCSTQGPAGAGGGLGPAVGQAEPFQSGMSLPIWPREPVVRDREVQCGFAWYVFRKGDFKSSFKKTW